LREPKKQQIRRNSFLTTPHFTTLRVNGGREKVVAVVVEEEQGTWEEEVVAVSRAVAVNGVVVRLVVRRKEDCACVRE
jgi:hypothetical protein